MSNSYKKTPVISNAGGLGQKKFRSQENRAKRTRIKSLLNSHDYDKIDLIHEKEYGNEWASPRDGRCYQTRVKKEWLRK